MKLFGVCCIRKSYSFSCIQISFLFSSSGWILAEWLWILSGPTRMISTSNSYSRLTSRYSFFCISNRWINQIKLLYINYRWANNCYHIHLGFLSIGKSVHSGIGSHFWSYGQSSFNLFLKRICFNSFAFIFLFLYFFSPRSNITKRLPLKMLLQFKQVCNSSALYRYICNPKCA